MFLQETETRISVKLTSINKYVIKMAGLHIDVSKTVQYKVL